MATYHINAKIGKKGKGESHAAYISREGKYSGGKRYEDLENTATGNMPEWAEHNAAHFWKSADQNERANGSVYREIEIALPREFTPAQRLELVQDFIQQEIGDKHAYQFAIHNPKAALEKGEQPHAHIMYSERIIDGVDRDPEQYFKRYNRKNPEKGGLEKFSGGKSPTELKAELLELREKWATVQNKHLEKNGSPDRVDHRSFKERGIDRVPEQRLGGEGVRNASPADKKALLELRNANRENQQATAEAAPLFEQVQKQTSAQKLALSATEKFKAGLAERAKLAVIAERKAEQDRRRAIRAIHFAEYEKNKAEKQKREQAAAEKYKQEQADREQAAIDKLKQEQADREQAAADKLRQEQADREQEQADREQAAADKLKQEQAEAAKAAALERRAQDKGAER